MGLPLAPNPLAPYPLAPYPLAPELLAMSELFAYKSQEV